MSADQLAKNIMYYRKKKGLSQKKVAEYMGVSRQAVTKWENAVSRPSSDNLIRLAQLYEVSVDALLDYKEQERLPAQKEISMGKMPWIFIGISLLCMVGYMIASVSSGSFSVGIFIPMFVLCVPIQLFLHIYFANAIKNDSFVGIAGFDDKIEYNICEVKKLLVQIDLHTGMMSSVYVFLLCVINCTNLKLGRLNEWLNGLLIYVYSLNFVVAVEFYNYKMIDRIYLKDNDKRRAKRCFPVAVVYIALLFVGIGIMLALFEIKGIENNTIPAMKICGLLLSGVVSGTVGFFLENKQIKEWNPLNGGYKINIFNVISICLCLLLYGLMCVV
ncbi:helix-turn-helix transcriptional regulator [Roseburia hominis]